MKSIQLYRPYDAVSKTGPVFTDKSLASCTLKDTFIAFGATIKKKITVQEACQYYLSRVAPKENFLANICPWIRIKNYDIETEKLIKKFEKQGKILAQFKNNPEKCLEWLKKNNVMIISPNEGYDWVLEFLEKINAHAVIYIRNAYDPGEVESKTFQSLQEAKDHRFVQLFLENPEKDFCLFQSCDNIFMDELLHEAGHLCQSLAGLRMSNDIASREQHFKAAIAFDGLLSDETQKDVIQTLLLAKLKKIKFNRIKNNFYENFKQLPEYTRALMRQVDVELSNLQFQTNNWNNFGLDSNKLNAHKERRDYLKALKDYIVLTHYRGSLK